MKRTPRKTRNPKPETRNLPAPALPPGNWADYLAARPEEKSLQMELIAKICQAVAAFKPDFTDLIQRNIDVAEMGRRVGIYVVELEDRLPGKKLTEDFWRQMEAVFALNAGQTITRDMLLWFARIARHHPEPITTLAQVRAVQQNLLLASGEEQYQLQAERAPQQAHAPAVPLYLLKQQLSVARLEDIWNSVKKDATSFVDGQLRPDLREELRVELAPAIRVVEEIKQQLGI